MPPSGDALASEFSRVTALSEIDVADIVIQVIDAERSDFPQFFDQPVVVVHMAGLAFRSILGASVLRKLFKNPCSQAELNKIVPFGFSLQRQKMVFFCHQNSITLLC